MTGRCLNCGKPLGNRTKLCYGCESEGVDPTAVVQVDDAVRERVERYFVVSSVKCSNCDEIHGTVTFDGEGYTAEDFGIETVEEWEREMEKEEDWIRDNREEVEAVLPFLEEEWPRTVEAVRTHVF